jgi:hypothetical protein
MGGYIKKNKTKRGFKSNELGFPGVETKKNNPKKAWRIQKIFVYLLCNKR